MKNINFSIIEGNLTRDPEYKETDAGLPFCKFTIANNNSFKKNGEWNNDVNYINVISWSRTAEACSKYLKKGDPVRIKGRIDQHNFKNTEGKTINIVEIIAQTVDFLPRKKNTQEIPKTEVA